MQREGFEVTEEEEKDIVDRHEDFHMKNLLEVQRRLPYVYGIYKVEKRTPGGLVGPRNRMQQMKANQRPL